MPEAEGDLQRSGVCVQPSRLGLRAPLPCPQGAEVAAALPQPAAPLAGVQVPEWVVDPGRLPVDDAGQPAAVGQQLTVVDVAVDQDSREALSGQTEATPQQEEIQP